MTEVLADQAAGLRQLLRGGRPRSITIASASPQAGCSVVAANLAVSLAREGRSVLVFDWSGGVNGVGWLLGVDPGPDLLEVLRRSHRPQDACATGNAGVRVVAAAGAAAALAHLSLVEVVRLEQTVEALQANMNVVIIDAGANDLPACAAADELMLVTQVDAQSVIETYRLVKRLTAVCGRRRANVLMNRIRIPAQADRFFGNLSTTAARFLSVTLELGSRIPYDDCVERATQLRQVVVEAFPGAPASKMLRNCAETMLRGPEAGTRQGGVFAGRLITVARTLGEPKKTVPPAPSSAASMQPSKTTLE
jgi:flagellar biosynthesis protein FlhG